MENVDVFRLPNRFDYSYHRTFTENSSVLLEKPFAKDVVLDFSIVEYIDSSALGMMVLFQKKASDKKIRIFIKGARGATEEILKMANMQRLFEFI